MGKTPDVSMGFGHPSGGFSEIWIVIVAPYLTLGYYVTSYSTLLKEVNERMNANASCADVQYARMTRNP